MLTLLEISHLCLLHKMGIFQRLALITRLAIFRHPSTPQQAVLTNFWMGQRCYSDQGSMVG